MKIVESDVKILEPEYKLGIVEVYKAIEMAARICYNSKPNAKISAEDFVKNLISAGHFRPLEFGTVYLVVPYECYKIDPNQTWWDELLKNPYTRYNFKKNKYYITTNYRVLVEKNKLYSLSFMIQKPSIHHYKRITVLWEPISRAIADEFRTHVSISSLMQSTRYCNFAKDRFGSELTFVASERFLSSDRYIQEEYNHIYNVIERAYKRCVTAYDMKAEEARDFLPLSISTTMIQCAYKSDWEHFLDLRCDKAAHPDARKLADKLKSLL